MSIQRPNGRGAKDRINVPCGSCPACLANKRSSWAFRLSQELKNAETASFITLTYDEDHNSGSISKTQIQAFLKRLRQVCKKVDPEYYGSGNRGKLRYFLTGEYGSNTNRPHYHMILFNHPVVPDIKLYEILGKSWQQGASFIGTVTEASIMYVAKYLLKGSVTPENCEAPFSLMSRMPGIGFEYVKRMADWHLADNRFYSIKPGGEKIGLPRYYRDKIFSKSDKEENELINQSIRDKKENEKLYKIFAMGQDPWELEDLQKKEVIRKVKKISKIGKL